MRLLTNSPIFIPAELNNALHAEATPDVRREQVATYANIHNRLQAPEGTVKDADALVEKSIWLISGGGWAYDIGFWRF